MTAPKMKLDAARSLADTIRPHDPEKAAEVEAAISRAEADKKDGVNIQVGVHYRLEKFHGDIEPGNKPYEVIEGTEAL